MQADFQRVKELFLAALQQDGGAKRSEFLGTECRSDLDLGQRVDAVLARHEAAGSFLESPAAPFAPTIDALFPSQAGTFDAALAADLVGIPGGRARQGTEVGHAVAQQILTWRSTDGSGATVPYTPGTEPGDWR